MFDLYVRCSLEEALEASRRLGWKGFCLVVPWKGRGELEKIRKGIKSVEGLDVSLGVEIEVKRTSQVTKLARDVRKYCDVVIVRGGELEVNRAAVETPEVDMLVSPSNNLNPGFNHIMARLCKKNNVSVCFAFHELLYSYKRSRSGVMSHFLEIAKLLRKYRAPFVIASGALSGWDMRSPSELISLGRVLGFQDREIKSSLSDRIIRENRKRLSGKFIMPGVEIE